MSAAADQDAILREVDDAIQSAVAHPALATDPNLLLVAAKGQRLRSRVSCAIAGPVTGTARRVLVDSCAAAELLHFATLIHDDIIDESPERRGSIAAWRSVGVDRALVLGDLLIGRAFGLATEAGHDLWRELSSAFVRVCHGQLTELNQVMTVRTVSQVEQVASDKTAALFGLAAGIGARASAGSPSPAIVEDGERLGLAYQLLDDLQDIDPAEQGPGQDLAEGVATSPWILSGLLPDEESLKRLTSADDRCVLLWATSGPSAAAIRVCEVLDPLLGHPFLGGIAAEMRRRVHEVSDRCMSAREA